MNTHLDQWTLNIDMDQKLQSNIAAKQNALHIWYSENIWTLCDQLLLSSSWQIRHVLPRGESATEVPYWFSFIWIFFQMGNVSPYPAEKFWEDILKTFEQVVADQRCVQPVITQWQISHLSQMMCLTKKGECAIEVPYWFSFLWIFCEMGDVLKVWLISSPWI